MQFLTIEELKAQCRIDLEDHSEDASLLVYGESAEAVVQNMINRQAEEIIEVWGELPPPLRQAMLVIAADGYLHREGSTPSAVDRVPYGVQNMISHYIKLTSRTNDEW